MKISTKLIITISALLGTTVLLASSSFENQPRCEKKANNIQKQLDIAKEKNNDRRVHGLEISLSKVKEYCSDSDLIEDIEEKIEDAKEDLNDHTQDYQEAARDNREDKMKKYQSKIDEDNAEIKKLLQELES